jgi:hypothetical protein
MAYAATNLRWSATRSVIEQMVVPLLVLLVATPLAGTASAAEGVSDRPCPSAAITVEPGASIQDVADRAGEGAAICLKNGIHRIQVVRPWRGQSFYGEGHTVLNGSRLLTNFTREGHYWVAAGQTQRGQKHGECTNEAPACDRPEGLFIDDRPLTQVLSKDSLAANQFYFDYAGQRIFFVDDPSGHKVEATVAAFAFRSRAANVLISNITVEKYASVAQKGAIHAREGNGWTIENCEVRLNSGAGINIGTGGRVRGCDIHHNGQIGIAGDGRDIAIERNHIWTNNIGGFDFKWEAGGVKIASSNGVSFLDNHVHDNIGPGLWCDINCRNVVYAGNIVEHNQDAGIFHEISFSAVIRDNIVRNNGSGHRKWFWGADIQIAASQDVDVHGNKVSVSAGGCGIVLIDQSRRLEGGGYGKYKTRNNNVYDNEVTFEDAPCAGGVSDAWPGDENFTIITDGNNRFDRNLYHVSRTHGPGRFVWGHEVFDWDGFRQKGLEPNGREVAF